MTDLFLGPLGEDVKAGEEVDQVGPALGGPDVLGQAGEPSQGGPDTALAPVLLDLLVELHLQLPEVTLAQTSGHSV